MLNEMLYLNTLRASYNTAGQKAAARIRYARSKGERAGPE